MNSATDIIPKNDETSFDTYEIDSKISKNGEYIKQNVTKKGEKEIKEIKAKFKLISDLTKEKIKPEDDNSDYQKYFAKIDTKNFKYIGILTNKLKRDGYGLSIMENEDKYLGQYKNENKEGFGIYKFCQNNEEQEIYIGDYKNNRKSGEGLYLKIFKSIKNESNEEIIINFNCGIGEFEDDIFKNGKIFSVIDDVETLYQGKMNERGFPSDENALVIEEGNKIFIGKIIDGEIIEGKNIFIDEKGEKKKSYYFNKNNNNKESPYDFQLNEKEEKDELELKKVKDISFKTYKNNIQNIFRDINSTFEKFSNFDTAFQYNFENDIKKKIQNSINKIIKE